MKTQNILAAAAGLAVGYMAFKQNDANVAGIGNIRSFNQLVSKVEELTDYNAHTESILTIANYYGLKKYASILNHISHIQDIEGFMPYELKQYREFIYKQIMEWLRDNLSPEQYNKLNSAL